MIYIIAIGSFQSLLLLLLMYNNKHKKPFDFFVKLLLLFVFVHLGIKFVIYAMPTGLFQKGFVTFIDLAYGPLLWMISLKLKNDAYRPAKHWYLYLPAMIATIFFVGITIFSLLNRYPPIELIEIYNNIATVLVLPLLFLFSILSLKNSGDIQDFWATERKLIRNISIIFLITSVIFIGTFFSNLLFQKVLLDDSIGRIIFYSDLVLVCIMILRYLMISQMEKSGIGNNADSIENLADELKTQEIDDQLENLVPLLDKELIAQKLEQNGHHQKSILEKLEKMMLEKKIYLDPELNLVSLAEMTHISRHHISEALNQHLGKTYYAYINEYRIKEVLILLDKCKKQGIKPNILSIAFEMGFNSKSTFHLYFKKITGSTPSAYIKHQTENTENGSFSTENKTFLNLGMN